MSPKHIAIINDHINQGGVGATTRRLAPEFIRRGYKVTSITIFSSGDIPGVENVRLKTSRWQRRTIFPLIWKLAQLMRQYKFDYVLSNKDPVNILVILAFKLARLKNALLLVNSRTNVMKVLEHEGSRLQYWSLFLAKHLYRYADLVANVSYKASLESERYFGVKKVYTLYNAVITQEAVEREYPVPDHPFFAAGCIPVVACGRLELAKNHALMIRAFAKALEQDERLRLIIVGEGYKRSELEGLCRELGVEERVSLIGYDAEPQKYMAHARLFWFTSLYEGFGNVLVEALSTGTNILSIDCEHGPAEILDNGRYGALLCSYDVEDNAKALLATLAHAKCTPEVLKKRALEFSAENCANAYLKLLESASARKET